MPYGYFNWMNLIFLALLFGAFFFMRRCGWGGGCGWHGRHSHSNGRSKALDILNQRYARGEIDSEEYRRKKEDILHGGDPDLLKN